MTIAKTRTFRSGNSEAVRLPKDVAFGEGVELVVVRSGDVVTLYPADNLHPRDDCASRGVAACRRPSRSVTMKSFPNAKASDGGVPARHQCRDPSARWRPH